MVKTNSSKLRKTILIFVLLVCIGILIIFKYLGFFLESASMILTKFSIPFHPITLRLLLPVGISFYTFQSLSYVIDVYKGKIKPEKHFGIYATFISFFPQLVAGPIERTENLLPQIRQVHVFDSNQAMLGLKLMAVGFFKKMVVADNLAIYADYVFKDLFAFTGFSILLATMFFSIQIYCDFSGYSDIARGAAKLVGIELMENFKSPYFSTSIKEFWSRWHISLSSWFRDYLYIPLGGNRVSKTRHSFNIFLTFLLSGMWHGANWTFVIWGGIHGITQIFETSLKIKNGKKISIKWIIQLCLVLIIVNFAWIFFRVQSLNEAVFAFSNMFIGIGNPYLYLIKGFNDINMTKGGLVMITLLVLLPLVISDYLAYWRNSDVVTSMEVKSKSFQWIYYLYLGLLIIFLAPKGIANEFVYFQF